MWSIAHEIQLLTDDDFHVEDRFCVLARIVPLVSYTESFVKIESDFNLVGINHLQAISCYEWEKKSFRRKLLAEHAVYGLSRKGIRSGFFLLVCFGGGLWCWGLYLIEEG